MQNSPQPAVPVTIEFGPGISIKGYMLSDGSVRYDLEYISVLMGYSPNYFWRLINYLRITKNPSNKLKSLQSKGFTAYQVPAKVSRPAGLRGTTNPKTLSYNDFCLIVEHEGEINNPKANALLSASFRELLRSRTQVAINEPEDTLLQKQSVFQRSYDRYLEWADVYAENREEIEDQWLPGDELYYPLHRDWEEIEAWGLGYYDASQ